jgi:YD repeat-containing protein
MTDGSQKSGKRAQITTPDGTVDKIYFVGIAGTPSGWSRGLPALVETSSGGAWQRKVMTTWVQDNTGLNYPQNPRVLETNVYDPAGNRSRVQFTYQQFTFANGTNCWLPQDVSEYAADATTVLRTTRTNYITSSSYTDLRILGLPSEKLLYEGATNGTLRSKTQFIYDGSGSIQGAETPVQHENPGPLTVRANLSTVKRFNMNNPIEATETNFKYNQAGAVVSTKDASNHEVIISYADSFSDGVSRNTFAYPTTVEDPDGYSATSKYNFDFGGLTYKRTPLPNVSTNMAGPELTYTFDTIGRLQQVTNLVNNAYTRFVYSPADLKVETYSTIKDELTEARVLRITDGAGRLIASATQHSGSTGGYSGQRLVYDLLGRVIKTSNPTETDANGTPFQWNTAGDDESTGWIYIEQTYDWKGRPLVTTNPSMTSNPADTTTRTLSYSGCGCAGGEVVTMTDEGTLDGGTAKRRQRKIYSDVLGRTVKTEMLNWESGTVYSATVNTYNVRDQVTEMKQYAGPAGAGTTFQTTTMSYDGYGRLQAKQAPEQTAATTYAYNNDDTLLSVTDGRGAVTSYARNGRDLVTGISYSAPSGSGIPVPAAVSYSYDAAGNRIEMTDGLGSATYVYNSLSRMTSETRNITQATPTAYTINYQYSLAGQLTGITDPNGNTINYTRDLMGRTSAITGTSFGGVSTYISSMSYRAWGAVKQVNYGNGKTLNATYNDRLKAETFQIPGVMSKSYEYYADGTLKFSSDLLDHRFDRLYQWDHAGRIKEALSGAEARGEAPSTDRPYKQLFAYDAMGHLTERTKYRWFLGPDTSTDSYTDNRHDPVGQLWQYDADGNTLSMPGTGYTYDAAGRIANMISGTPSTVTLSWDGDGKKTKSVEAVWDPQTETDITTTSYFIHSTVLGRTLTEFVYSDDPDVTVPGFFTRTFVYGDSGGVIAYQMGFGGGSGEVWWEYRDPGNASYRAETNTGAPNLQELDPTGANQGVTDPATQSIPDQGLLAPYPNTFNPSHPFATYSIDGMRVSLDEFIQQVLFQFHGELGLNEAIALEDPNLPDTDWVPPSNSEEDSLLTSSSMWIFGLSPGGPKNTAFDITRITNQVDAIIEKLRCVEFGKRILNAVSTKDNPVIRGGDLRDIFDDFLLQENGGYTRTKLPGSAGYGSPRGLIRKGNGTIFSPAYSSMSGAEQTEYDAATTVAELFHMSGRNEVYTDRALAEAARSIPEYAALYRGVNPESNVFDQRYRDKSGAAKNPNHGGWSSYFHDIQRQVCGP